MGGSFFTDVGVLFIEIVFGLYLLAIMLRFILQIIRADFSNQVAKALIQITNPPLKPLRKLIPGIGGIDWASIILMIAVMVLKLVLLAMLISGKIPPPVNMALLVTSSLLKLLLQIYLFSIVILVIISWVNPGAYNPIVNILHQITEPLMRPARRVIPPVAGLDLSPMVVLFVLFVMMMLVDRLYTMGLYGNY